MNAPETRLRLNTLRTLLVYDGVPMLIVCPRGIASGTWSMNRSQKY